MNTVAVVFAAEFERRFRSRTFIFGTLIGAVLIAGIAFLPALFGSVAGSSNKIMLAGDPALTSAASKLLARDFIITETLPNLPAAPSAAYLEAHGKATAAVLLERRGTALHVRTYTRNPGELRGMLSSDLEPLQIALATGAAPSSVQARAAINVDEHDVSGHFADANQAVAAKGVGYVFVFLLYLAIVINAQSIIAAVAEEKTSRIAELLVATLDPARLLLAKVLAATATGFAQLAVWMGTSLLVAKPVARLFADGAPGVGGMSGSAADAAAAVTPPEILWFVLFFFIGFAQCAVLFAAAGSLVNRTEDIGTISGPLYLPIVGAIFIAQLALLYPNAPNVVAFSFIPLIAPFVMFTRVIVGNVPAWQLVFSITLNILAAIALAWFAGRVYRIGLLLYGRFPSPRQLLAALRAR